MIIVVEDEPMIPDLLVDQLEESGFEVLSASDAAASLATFNANSNEIVALITDVRLGAGAPGWDVARHVRTCVATMPVIYMTADSAAEWAANGVPNSVLVQKPFVPAQIITAASNLPNAQTLSATNPQIHD